MFTKKTEKGEDTDTNYKKCGADAARGPCNPPQLECCQCDNNGCSYTHSGDTRPYKYCHIKGGAVAAAPGACPGVRVSASDPTKAWKKCEEDSTATPEWVKKVNSRNSKSATSVSWDQHRGQEMPDGWPRCHTIKFRQTFNTGNSVKSRESNVRF